MSDTHSHHVTSVPVLLATFAGLVLLTILTVYQATADWIELGRFEIFVTLGIATAKALLVALIFMQLAHDKPLNGIILITSLLFVALFLSFALMDTQEYKRSIEDFRLGVPKTADDP